MSGEFVPRVVGLDLSLTSTGVSDGGESFVVQTSPVDPIEARMDHILRSIMTFLLNSGGRGGVDLVVIEGPAAIGGGMRGQEGMSGLRMAVRHKLWRVKVPFAIVPPTALKKYTTGYGGADKAAMVATVDARHHTEFAKVPLSHGRTDLADAFALAAMGYDRIGHPLPADPDVEPPKRGSLDAVAWPDIMSD